MPGGYAADDGVALHFHGSRLWRAVSSHAQAGAYRVTLRAGRVREYPLDVRYLGGAGRGHGGETGPGRPPSRQARSTAAVAA